MATKDDKPKIPTAGLHVLIACATLLHHKVLPDGDVREIYQAGGFTGIAQNLLTEALKIARDNFDNSLLARLTNLAKVSKEELVICAIDMLEHNLNLRVNDKYVADMAVNAELQESNTKINLENTNLRTEQVRLNDLLDQLQKSQDAANSNITDLLERNRKLELEKTLLEGRLLEREANSKRSNKTATPPDTPSGPKRRRKNAAVTTNDSTPE